MRPGEDSRFLPFPEDQVHTHTAHIGDPRHIAAGEPVGQPDAVLLLPSVLPAQIEQGLCHPLPGPVKGQGHVLPQQQTHLPGLVLKQPVRKHRVGMEQLLHQCRRHRPDPAGQHHRGGTAVWLSQDTVALPDHGTGVLYVNKNSLDKIKQSYAGYLNTTVPEGGWGAYWEKVDAQAVYDWTFPNTARKYEIGGTSNYAGAIALGESLGLVNEIGIENIQQRVWEIGEYCMDRWEEIGGTVITHRDPGRRGGIIITRLYQDVEQDRAILRELHSRQIFIAQRFTDHVGGFRISCSWVNNREDIDNMIEAVKEIIASIGRAPDYKG